MDWSLHEVNTRTQWVIHVSPTDCAVCITPQEAERLIVLVARTQHTNPRSYLHTMRILLYASETADELIVDLIVINFVFYKLGTICISRIQQTAFCSGITNSTSLVNATNSMNLNFHQLDHSSQSTPAWEASLWLVFDNMSGLLFDLYR